MLVQNRAASQIKILELGAGTGASSNFILKALSPYQDRIKYVYSDISVAFLQHGRRKFADQYPFVDFQLLDIEKQPEAGHNFDLIVATNVLHATRDLQVSLGNVKKFLKKDGILVLQEVTCIPNYINLIFGVFQDWWGYNDVQRRRPDSPLLSEQMWRQLLQAEGFSRIFTWGESPRNNALTQHIILAEKSDKGSLAAGPSRGPEKAETFIIEALAQALHLETAEIDPQVPYAEFGVDSILAVKIIEQLNTTLEIDLKATDLFNFATVCDLAEHIRDKYKPAAVSCTDIANHESLGQDIAIIGAAGKFPGASDIHSFWQNLLSAGDMVREIPPKRWPMDGFYDPDPQAPDRSYCKWGAFIEQIENFDPRFFNIAPKEAQVIDPQQRLFLMEAYKALEDAGYATSKLAGKKCGVFVGCAPAYYKDMLKQVPLAPMLLLVMIRLSWPHVLPIF